MKVGLRYAAVLAAVGAALWFGFRDEVLGSVLVAWRTEIAGLVLTLIQWAGMEAIREGSVIYHPGGFAYEISRGCTGLVPAVLLATAICAYPATARHRLLGAGLGVLLLLGLNLARLVHLFYVGVHQPRWFHVAHSLAWEAVVVLAVVGLWLTWTLWTDRAARRYRSVSQRSSSTVTIRV